MGSVHLVLTTHDQGRLCFLLENYTMLLDIKMMQKYFIMFNGYLSKMMERFKLIVLFN